MTEPGANQPAINQYAVYQSAVLVDPPGTTVMPGAVAGDGSAAGRLDAPAALPSHRLLVWEMLAVLALLPLRWTTDAVLGLLGGNQDDALPVALPHHQTISAALLTVSFLVDCAPLALVGYLLARSGESLRALGLSLRFRWRDLGAALLLAGAVALAGLAAAPLVDLIGGGNAGWTDQPHLSAAFLAPGWAMALSAGIAEETVVVGYLMHRLRQIGASPGLMIAASAGVRVAYHLYYGTGALSVLVMGLLFAWRWHRTRNLTRLVAAHTIYDGVIATVMVVGG